MESEFETNPCLKVLASIPYCYAGMHVDALSPLLATSVRDVGDTGRIFIKEQEYSVFNSYLVPYYASNESELNRRSEQLVLDRVKRFFYSTEPGLDVPWTREAIAEEQYAYIHCTDQQLKAVKGRLLVGVMVNRMGRLAQAILQRNIDGISLEIAHGEQEYKLSEEQIAAFRKEFRDYYHYLVQDEKKTPVRHVHRQDGSPDRDGFLLDLVRELGKPLMMNLDNERYLYSGLLQKIGYAMEAIDEVRRAMQLLIDEPQMQSVMQTSMRGEGKAETYAMLLDEFTTLCRARSGFKAQDRINFGAVRERIEMLYEQLSTVHHIIERRSTRGYSPTAQGTYLLIKGVAMMHDMAVTRYPLNHYSHSSREALRDESSVGLFTMSVSIWRSSAAQTTAQQA